MASVILVYSTTDGHTVNICQYIKAVLEQHGHQAALISIDEVSQENIEQFDKIVVGASVRYGNHNKKVLEFVVRHQKILNSKPGAFFSVNVTARKPDKNQPDTNPYMRKFLKQVPWQPDRLAVFAGKIDYPKYQFFDRVMIRLIMYITKGPTDPDSVTDFTDWKQVENFSVAVSEM